MTCRARITGVGSFVPARSISNARIAKAIPGWPAERIEEKLGIRERRFLWDFDTETGKAIAPPADEPHLFPADNSDMCEVALRGALEMAGISGSELDAIFLVTCTPDELNFGHDAMELHRRVGARTDAFAQVIDDGCGGTPYVIDMAQKMLAGGTFKTIAVVASAFTSPLVNREVFTSELSTGGEKPLNAFLSLYVFGDGAGAVVLRGESDPRAPGIEASMSGNEHGELVMRRGGGFKRLFHQGRASSAEMAYIVNGPLVARSYPRVMQRCLDGLFEQRPELRDEVERFYFHQPNKRLLDLFVSMAELPADRVASHVETHGNTSAAGMLILLAEDLNAGRMRLGSGQLGVIAAVGANIHYGAQLFRI
jgi:3-oxoacyl-[acyl-carrier-protein] synthase-3